MFLHAFTGSLKSSRRSFSTTISSSFISSSIIHVELKRPVMNLSFWKELTNQLEDIDKNDKIRCIVLSSSCSSFSFGLDLKDEEQVQTLLSPGEDPARKSEFLRRFLSRLQNSFSLLERLPPVICCIHSHCIGGAMDLVCATDIRYCTKDVHFSIKEVDVGLAPDLGTLQRIERLFKSSSLVRELAFTGRPLLSEEAKECGFVSSIFSTKDEMLSSAFNLARRISEKSPVAISGIKRNLNYSRGRPVEDALAYQALWSSAALQTTDIKLGMAAAMTTKKSIVEFKDLQKKD